MRLLITSLLAAALLVGCGSESRPSDSERRAKRKLDSEARLAKGAYIESTKAISPDEEISILIVPQGSGHRFDDRRCIIYRHKEFKTASVSCEAESTLPAE